MVQDAVLSYGEPRDAAVNFDTYRILQRHRAVSLPQHDGWLGKTIFFTGVRYCHSRSSKVIDFGTDRKHVCDFLLVRHGNLGPILRRFGDIAGFCARDPTPIPP